ncbi:hypothetical protein ACNJYC_23435 [Bradyrhizobium sp. DASA03007]|uniref:hypothetical protein n=1 Tax=Bradyrhizobium sp. SPXBL-03 TaxID=3395913 RepID=UPI003F6EAF30
MMARDCAATREAAQRTGRGDQRSVRDSATSLGNKSPGEMALQANRGLEAAPQTFVRLTGSHLAKPRCRQ